MTINLGKITQGDRGTFTYPWHFPENLTTPASVLGATITATMQDLRTGEVTDVTGTLTGTAAAEFTWAYSAGDSGTDGAYSVILKAIVSGVATYTLAGVLVIEANPAVTGTQNDPLLSIPAADAAWAAAGRATVPDGTDLVSQDELGTAAAADVGDFDAAGSATAAQAAAIADAATKYYNQSAFSAAPTAAEPLKADGSGGIRFAAKISAGTVATADDTLFNAKRSITGAINSHAYRDESTHTPGAGSTGYGAFDAEFSMSGGQSYDHFAGFQNRPIFAGSGTITKHRGFWSLPTHTGTGTITSLQHFHVSNVTPSGGGAITTQYGLYVDELTGGSTDWAVFTAGATPSFFGGLLQAGSNFRVDGLASFGGVAANTAYQVYVPSNLDATKVAAVAALALAPINLNTGSTYGLFFSNAAQNNTLAAIGTNYVYGMSGIAGVIATGANSAARATYAARFQSYFQANPGYTSTAIYAFAIHVDSFGAVGAGTIALGETCGVNIENQSTAKSPTSHGIRIVDQVGSATAYSIWTGAGTVRLMGANTDKIGFHGVTPVARQLLATGGGATVDQVITALQNLGLLRQS